MRTNVATAVLIGAILLEFFLLACSLVVLGLAMFVAHQWGIGAGWLLVAQAWPLLLASVMVLLAGWAARVIASSPVLP